MWISLQGMTVASVHALAHAIQTTSPWLVATALTRGAAIDATIFGNVPVRIPIGGMREAASSTASSR